MKTRIVIRTRFEATHQYEDCPIPGVDYLQHPHRHMFYVEVKFAVIHDNREIEFLTMKAKIDKYLSVAYANKFLFSKSCEMIATEILNEFNASFVSIFEDNENGAEVYQDIRFDKTYNSRFDNHYKEDDLEIMKNRNRSLL